MQKYRNWQLMKWLLKLTLTRHINPNPLSRTPIINIQPISSNQC